MTIPTLHSDRRRAMALAVAWLGAAASQPVMAKPLVVTDEAWQDTRRQRAVPVRIRWPQGLAPADGWPVVMYSHGLGGSRGGGDVWGHAWATAGFMVVHLQHAGSDIDAARSVASSSQGGAALRKLGSGEQLLARLQDVVFAIDEIARRKTIDKAWRFVRTTAVGVAGHSFGAHTALGVGGQSYPNAAAIKEPRIAALIALSPTLPARGDVAQAFADVTLPTLCITGTRDDDVLGNGATPSRRAGVFDALPPGNKAMLLLKDADHMTFAGKSDAPTPDPGGQVRAAGILPRVGVTDQLQPQHHALTARISTDWWRAHLMGDAQASARLHQPSGLNAADSWRTG